MEYCSIVPREVVEKYGKDFRRHPCGTGPFRLQSWEEGQALILLKNEHYFDKDSAGKALPYLDAVKVTFNEEKAAEFLLFRQGQLDFINEIDPSFKDEVLSKKGVLKADWKGKIILSVAPQLNTEYLGILVDSTNPLVKGSPLRLRAVRQAMNYGFDRRKMILYLKNSLGLPAESGFVPAGLPSFDSTRVHGYHYDPDRARTLLASAGFADGKGVGVIKLLTVPNYGDFANFIARELEDIGLHIQVEVVQKSLLLEETAQSEAFFFRGSWIADYPDAENYLSVFYLKTRRRLIIPVIATRSSTGCMSRRCGKTMILYGTLYTGRWISASWISRRSFHLWYDEVVHLINPRVVGLTPNGLNLWN